jgi:hypothetical protein
MKDALMYTAFRAFCAMVSKNAWSVRVGKAGDGSRGDERGERRTKRGIPHQFIPALYLGRNDLVIVEGQI